MTRHPGAGMICKNGGVVKLTSCSLLHCQIHSNAPALRSRKRKSSEIVP
jgi:hypothetical protein